jgi:hypothetical protein
MKRNQFDARRADSAVKRYSRRRQTVLIETACLLAKTNGNIRIITGEHLVPGTECFVRVPT